MNEQTFIQVRVDLELKRDATEVLEAIGMDMPNAIRMFLKRVVMEKGLPFEAKLPEKDVVAAENENTRTVITIPAKPSLHVPMEEYLFLLCQVPAGKVTRSDDIEAYLKKIHGTDRITIDWGVIGYQPDIPFWRRLSTRGMLSGDKFYCSVERQQEMLEKEGLVIVPCGAYNRSLKVENYKEHLFDFDSLGNILDEVTGQTERK